MGVTFIPNKLLLLTYFIALKKPRRKTSQLNCFCTLEKIALIYINYPSKINLVHDIPALQTSEAESQIRCQYNSKPSNFADYQSKSHYHYCHYGIEGYLWWGVKEKTQMEQTAVLVSSSRGRGRVCITIRLLGESKCCQRWLFQ